MSNDNITRKGQVTGKRFAVSNFNYTKITKL